MNTFKPVALKMFAGFVKERESIRVKKEAGKPWPWTKDPVLRTYRFCNVRRNDDKETRLIHRNWLVEENPDAWFAMTVARIVNWWPSLEEVGYPVPWDQARFKSAMARRKAEGAKAFTGAYMIHADAHAAGSKADYLAERVLTPMWEDRAKIRPVSGDTLDSFHKRLIQYRDMGSFMAGQVVADTKYAPRDPLAFAPDFFSWATSGPGSMKGLNYVAERDPATTFNEKGWRAEFAIFQQEVAPYLDSLPPITGQDLQNCLCEFSKWRRGTSRSKYTPKESK